MLKNFEILTRINIRNPLFILLMISGCVHGTTGSSEVNRFVRQFSREAKTRNHVIYESVGLSFPKDVIHLIDISFSSDERVDIDKARQMIVQLTEDFVRAYRSNSELAPYLPYGVDDRDGVLVSISYERYKMSLEDCSTPVTFVFFNKHRLVYFTSSGDVTGLKEILEESYAEAYEKVMGTRLLK